MSDAHDMRQVWGRVVRWLEEYAPRNAESLQEPATQKMINDAETAMGIAIPQEIRSWLLINNGVKVDPDPLANMAASPSSFLPCEWHLLPVEYIVKVYERQMKLAQDAGHPAHADREELIWHRNWVPFAVEADWLYGLFIDAETGAVGGWSDGDTPNFETHATLAGYFNSVADAMIRSGTTEDGRLVW
ncbi:SMI1/KNR4 family protein [Streptomyces lunaelactis]|nr:SMI1/KNR4 family protein [Streptomyces lunaelactis]NUK87075.1 SMI1/KNR4 family protein [Streptomyces lunaelactis]